MPTSTLAPTNSSTVIEIIASASTSVSNSGSSTSPSSRVSVKRVSSGIRHHRRHHRHVQSTQSTVSLPVTSRSYDSGRDIVIQLPFVDNRVRTVTAAVLWPSSPIRCSRSSASDRFSYSPNSCTSAIPSTAVDSIHSTSSSGGTLPVLVSSILDGALKKHSQLSERRANNTQLFIACDSRPNSAAISRSVQMFGDTGLSD